jgi:hypothetical protein
LLTYQGVYLSELTIPGIAEQIEEKSIFELATATAVTLENLQERTPLWEFNYEVLEADLNGQVRTTFGGLLFSEVGNYVPAAVYGDKTIFDVDYALSRAASIEERDWPGNLFAYTVVDFSVFALLAAPLLLVIFFLFVAAAVVALPAALGKWLFSGFMLHYILQLEAAYTAPLQLLRDFVVAYLLLLIAPALRSAMKKRLRAEGARQYRAMHD